MAAPELPLPDARTTLDDLTVIVPLPDTHQRAMAVRVPGWDDFVGSLLPGNTPLECPHGVIQPSEYFGEIPTRFFSTSSLKAQVLVYAPGCTPPAATGVDATGVWYNGPHDECQIWSQHRHTWHGSVHKFMASTLRTKELAGVLQDGRMADIASRYLDALERAGIPPGPLRCLYLVSPPSPSPCPQQPPTPAKHLSVSPPSTASAPPQPQLCDIIQPPSPPSIQPAHQPPPISLYPAVCPFASGAFTGGVSNLDREMMAELGKKRDREMVDRLDMN